MLVPCKMSTVFGIHLQNQTFTPNIMLDTRMVSAQDNSETEWIRVLLNVLTYAIKICVLN